MTRRFRVLMLVVSACAFQAGAQTPAGQPLDHVAWVAQALQRMLTIQTGMTRGELLKVFTTEGGISTRTQRTYVSRECPYFKVDVEFKQAGPPGPNGAQLSFGESEADVIVKISRPYVGYGIAD